MTDATCSRCGKRFGWMGALKDCPPCPRCKFTPARSAEDDEALKEMEALLTKKMFGDEGDDVAIPESK